MAENLVVMSEEQLQRLLASPRVGVGAIPPGTRKSGFGCPGSPSPGLASAVQLLEMGSVRLGLARCRGIPFAPYMVNVRARFPDTTTAVVPDVGSDVKITQDTLFDAMVVRVFNRSTTANQNIFQAQSDWYFNWQSGIEATLDVQGAPRYTVADRFTPLANLMDAFNGDSRWGAGWIVGGGMQQQLFMSFNATVVLPFAPMEVVCSFRGWAPVNEGYGRMDVRTALDALKSEFGFEFSDSYVQQVTQYG